jgi:nicotinamide N-methyltransferase
MIAALRGATRTVITDYPAEEVVRNIHENVRVNLTEKRKGEIEGKVEVEGHEWGKLEDRFAVENKGVFERVLVADCLWMPWQHGNLRRSIAWFLSPFISSSSSSTPTNISNATTSPAELEIPSHHYPPSLTHPYHPSDGGRAYIIAGFHTGRAKMASFFDEEAMREDGLVVERIWERNAEGKEREWRFDRGEEDKDVTGRKRWLVVGIVTSM